MKRMTERIMALGEGSRAILLAPVVRERKGEHRRELAEFRSRGFRRVRIDGEMHELDSPPTLNRKLRHDIEVVVDRIVVREGVESRLADSLQTALALADGIALLETAPREGEGEAEKIVFSEKFACPISGFTIPELEPRLFSFNAPMGACPNCDGLGEEWFFDPDLVIPDPKQSVRQGAIAPFRHSHVDYFQQTIDGLERYLGADLSKSWSRLPETARQTILEGTGDEKVEFVFLDPESGRARTVRGPFEGVLKNLERRWRKARSHWEREEFARFRNRRECVVCDGTRLRPEALAVRIAGLSISDVVRLNVREALDWTRGVDGKLPRQQAEIARGILKEIAERLGFLDDVGLSYLTLNRRSGSLSGGESQRIRLASQIGSGLSGVLYVLDEPSIGLHQRDNSRLLRTLANLRDRGNTVIVVEHDEEAIRSADYIVDLGPGAGVHGGELVAAGSLDQIEAAEASLTGDYLTGRRAIKVPDLRRKPDRRRRLRIRGATANNLKSITVEFPARRVRMRDWVSGSGKSSLVVDTLFRSAAQTVSRFGPGSMPAPVSKLEGFIHIDKVIDIDQSPIGRTPRLQPGDIYRRIHPDPRLVRQSPGISRARIPARPLLLQRSRGPLRSLQG